MAQANLTSADFASIRHTFTETACGVGVYGAYAVLFIITVYMLAREGLSQSRVRQILLAMTFIMFSGASVIEMIYVRLFLMRIETMETGTETDIEWNHLYTALVVLSRVNYLLSDGIVVWRAYILYSRNVKVQILLVVCMVGSIVAAFVDGVFSIKFETRTHSEREGFISFILFIPLLVTNTIATCFVAFRAWEYRMQISSFVMSEDKQSGSKPVVERILILLVESGLIYIAYWIISMMSALGLMGDLGNGILECILPQIAGIYLTLIILLVAFQKSTKIAAPTPESATNPNIDRDMVFAAGRAHDEPFGSQSLSGFTPYSSTQSRPPPQIGFSFVERLKEVSDSEWMSSSSDTQRLNFKNAEKGTYVDSSYTVAAQ